MARQPPLSQHRAHHVHCTLCTYMDAVHCFPCTVHIHGPLPTAQSHIFALKYFAHPAKVCQMCILFTVEKRCSVVNVAQVWGHTTTWTGAHMSHDLDTDDDYHRHDHRHNFGPTMKNLLP